MTYGYLWALDESTPLEDPAVARGAQLAEHAAAYLAQLSRQHDDEAYAVSDLISPDLDRVRRAVTRIEDQGLIDRRSPGGGGGRRRARRGWRRTAAAESVDAVTEPVEPTPIGAGRPRASARRRSSCRCRRSTMTDPRWKRPP